MKLKRPAHDDYMQDVIGANLLDGGNQKKFWSFVRLNRTINMGIPILSDIDDLHITEQAKAECLNNPFASVFTRDNGTDITDNNIRFTQPGIEMLLKNINSLHVEWCFVGQKYILNAP